MGPAHGVHVGPDVVVPDRAELLQIVGRVQSVLADRVLAAHGVEEEAVASHPRAGRHARVALRVHQVIAAGIPGEVELPGDQTGCAVGHDKGLPGLGPIPEHGAGGGHADHVQGQGLAQGVVHLPEHLIGLVHPDPVVRIPQDGLSEPVQGTHPDARLPSRTQVHAEPVHGLVAQRGLQSFT